MSGPNKNLQKAALAGFVIFCFFLYSVQQRQGSPGLVIPPPADTAVTTTPTATNTQTQASTGQYKDGQYTGDADSSYYGYIQVEAVIQGGKLTDIQILQSPNDRSTSVEINSQALPYLKQEALQAQSSNINAITGASDTSQAFTESLASALNQAH